MRNPTTSTSKTEWREFSGSELCSKLVEFSTAPTFVLDAEHKVRIWNRACEELTGVKAADVLGTDSHWKAFYRQQRPCLADIVIDGQLAEMDKYYAISGPCPVLPEGVHGEGWFENLGGARRYLVFDAVPIRAEQGRVTAVIETLSDITQRKLAWDALMQKEVQLAQARRLEAVGRLAGGIAHKFNNLLTPILGLSEMMRAEIGEEHPCSGDLNTIIRAARQAAHLTAQFLAFSRRRPTATQLVDPNEVVSRIADLMGQTIGEDILISTTLALEAGCILADRSMLEQILTELMVNARDAMPKGGHLAVKTSRFRLPTTGRRMAEDRNAVRDYVRISIQDTGQGMPPEVQARIFEPFFTTKGEGKGIGLGLSLVYGLVEQFRGYIEIKSQPGLGTDVILYFPRVEAHNHSIDLEPDETALARGTETILLAEDDDVLRRYVVRMLRLAGYKVIEAADGAEALELGRATKEAIDLVITDVIMPNLGGHDLVTQLSRRRPGFKTLYMSGFSSEALLGHNVVPQTDPVMVKPFSRRDLLTRVRQILDAPP